MFKRQGCGCALADFRSTSRSSISTTPVWWPTISRCKSAALAFEFLKLALQSPMRSGLLLHFQLPLYVPLKRLRLKKQLPPCLLCCISELLTRRFGPGLVVAFARHAQRAILRRTAFERHGLTL